MTVRMLTGDCRTMLATLPDASVQMCVTSPPYFGLRDYGTASWDGGDAACDHRKKNPEVDARTSTLGPNGTGLALDNAAYQHGKAFRDTCGKCGATRVDQQIGLEPTVEAYVAQLVAVFREVRRVLRDDGVLFLNLGDSYATSPAGKTKGDPFAKSNLSKGGGLANMRVANESSRAVPRDYGGLKPKDLIGIPWRVAFALQADGWYLRSDIIWAKPNPMPESVKDRCTKSHEYIFHLTKSPRYFWDAEAVSEKAEFGEHHAKYQGTYTRHKIESMQENGAPNGTQYQEGLRRPAVNPLTRNIRSVWTIATSPFSAAHFATFPPALAERCIKAGTSEKGACSDCGAPWVRVVERESFSDRPQSRPLGERGQQPSLRAAIGQSQNGGRHVATETTGWQPTCPCDAPVVPCVVLDPFGGAGTVSLVAERLGRDSIYIDLSPEYAAMARKRITGEAPMFANVEG